MSRGQKKELSFIRSCYTSICTWQSGDVKRYHVIYHRSQENASHRNMSSEAQALHNSTSISFAVFNGHSILLALLAYPLWLQ